MGQVKFRAWYRNKMYYDGFIVFADGRTAWPEGGWDLHGIEDDHILIMRFTGAYDKSGTEIYEGDKIRFWFYTDLISQEKIETQAVIEYNNHDCCFYAKDEQNMQLYFMSQIGSDCEVFGHIYEK